MKIRPIFTKKGRRNLWAVSCQSNEKKEKKCDSFTLLMKQLNDTNYLFDFFKKHINELNNPFWNGLSIDEAIDKVRAEVNQLESELYSVELCLPGYENIPLTDIFHPLHENIYSLNFSKESYRKAKPDFSRPMVRIYGIELEDGSIIITGGAIKLSQKMEGEFFEEEFRKLDELRFFLNEEKIVDKEGLIELLT